VGRKQQDKNKEDRKKEASNEDFLAREIHFQLKLKKNFLSISILVGNPNSISRV
jgi:hypothetical protein